MDIDPFACSATQRTNESCIGTCHLRPRPPGHQVFQSLHSTCTSAVLTRSTRSLLHVHLRLSMSPSVSHRGWSSGAPVPHSKPHVHPSPLPVHRHGPSLLDIHLSIDHHLRAPHLHTTSILHNIVDNHSSLGDHMSTYRPCVHNHPIYIRLNCMLHGRGCSLVTGIDHTPGVLP
jgi:hypothetical protein